MAYIRFTSALLVILAITGCGDSGGNNAPRGTVCPEKINPFPVDLNEKNEASKPQKIALTPEAMAAYPGTYVYDGAEIFYRNNKTDAQMQFTDSRNQRSKEKEFNISIVCVSGLKPDMTKISFAELGLSDMEVLPVVGQSTSSISFFVRNYVIEFDKSRFPQKKAEKGSDAQTDVPSKVYEGAASQYFFYKVAANNQVDFQTRSRFIRGRNGEEQVDLVIRYKRTPPAEPTP